MHRPRIAITMGDPDGIGPEIIVKAVPQVMEACRPVLIGETAAMHMAVKRYGGEYTSRLSRDIPMFVPEGISNLRPVSMGDELKPLSPASRGEMEMQCVRLAAAMAQKGDVDAIVTGPISKETLAATGSSFPGHTEFLAFLTRTHPPVMMLAGPKLRVVPLTTHCALAEVPARLTRELIEVQITIVHRDLGRYFGLKSPRIALCGLNPHAGENGIFGREEIEVMEPAAAALRERGIDVRGPFPADTVFLRAVRGEFDVVCAPTHDQALIPLKLLHFDEGVNVTLGLPIIRTSPDHGTAFDIAWKGVASPTSMIAALHMATEMAVRVKQAAVEQF